MAEHSSPFMRNALQYFPDFIQAAGTSMSDRIAEQTKRDRRDLLNTTTELANEFLDGVAERPVAWPVDFEKLLTELNGAGLQREGDDPNRIVGQLAQLAEHAIVATAGPRYFGFVGRFASGRTGN